MSPAVEECFGYPTKQLWMSSVSGDEIRFDVSLKPLK